MEDTKKNIRFIYARIFVASIILGLAYGLVTHFNPFIYVNVLFLAVIIGILIFLMKQPMRHRKMKSQTTHFIYGVVICILAWLTSWATYYVFDTENGILKIFANPGKFIEFIFEYAHKNKLSVGRGSSKIRIDKTIMAILYIAEFVVFLLPAFVTFRKNKSNTNTASI